MSDTLSSIGQLIKELREKRGITQVEFAEKLNTTQSAIARIESGEQNLTTEMIQKISNALEREIVTVSKGAMNFEVDGGHKLSGTITTKTSKNGAMGIISASLLNKGRTTIKNVPKIEEVYRMVEVLESIGVNIKWSGNDLEIQAENINLKNINKISAEKTRSIIMLIGSLVHRLKRFSLPQSGGCKLGARTVTPHLFALENYGINIVSKSKSYEVSAPKLKPAEYALYESGDTVTENALIAAAMIPGKSVIKFASANYMVQDLCFFLEDLGVKIDGIGTSTLTVYGIKEINKNVTYHLGEDPIDTMFFLATAVVTNSSIEIKRCPINFLEIELLKLKKMGVRFKLSKTYKGLNGRIDLVDIKTSPSKLTALQDKIEAHPYPGLNIDNLPFFAVIATQARGQTLIHDWIYEKRAIHYKELDKLGADTILADPHRFYVNGKAELKPAEVICPPALRPAAIILIGMLGAKGKSVLRNVYSINRGYEEIAERLNALGAKIKILRE
ncbi:MAG: UDP-N-acetylglucosamine 1-carboxyvinyltransferase [bacterium]